MNLGVIIDLADVYEGIYSKLVQLDVTLDRCRTH
jgi:hypothetical protein